jgi:5'-3' exonuclease
MGVRFLNRLIQSKCQASVSTSGTAAAIERIHFEQLRGKKVAVDISIYIYRFLAEGALLENMYLLASIFRYYDINAIFVFDGPPPAQKTDVIEARKKKKDDAKRQFQVLETTLKTKKMEPRVDTHEIAEIEESMTQLKKQFIHIRDNDIINVKDLLISFGFTIVDAEGEADALCAKLTIKRRVFACMSDDTDMFVYGCPFILRHVSLLNHSAVCYNMSEILSNMKLTQDEFKMICIANGTDYNSPAPPMPIPPSVVVGGVCDGHEKEQ